MVRLWSFGRQNNVWFSNQFGFVKGGSTVDAMFKLSDKVVHALDQGISVSRVFFFYQRKTFDLVPHSLLLKKLDNMGVRCSKPMDFFLLSRKESGSKKIFFHIRFAHTLKRRFSDVPSVKPGVSQCSILGALLFVLHKNDLGS